ncbi:RNA polymerase sigma-70 factor [Taibaiella chishuiensis]|uniref:RNA polymerase sigma-70 factor (ECF subfamily) n=1 Tax=Taibaiella chishuiensis TaxID=1434707 RepID=A0A2P8D0J3_9BACT|nr:RNA polymerase sigma-70 factor [Taibaiella chishuiensis]PSK90731.1 RNA polymerase sigma-70 factor (ECF subfamily) [Taibaiella chishuiensis]
MLVHTTDELLFLSIKEEDPYAFRILVDKYCDALLKHCCTYVKRRDIAEEIVSDVLLALWEKKHKINIVSSLRSYLYTATRNHSIDYLRAQTRNVTYENIEDVMDAAGAEGSLGDFDSRDYTLDFRQELEALLIVLPPKRRKIFILYKDGMKHKEIAEMLRLSEKTVRNNIERAVRQLKASAINYGKVSPLVLLLLVY